jgi:hypothetical protein
MRHLVQAAERRQEATPGILKYLAQEYRKTGDTRSALACESRARQLARASDLSNIQVTPAAIAPQKSAGTP